MIDLEALKRAAGAATPGEPNSAYIAAANPTTIIALIAMPEKRTAALEVLSRLGNGDRLGNSDGNTIAQIALREDT